ncbi:MAG: hypothetical protein AABY65_08885 [Nitrospirota bacterium]|mgnify:CR=1 FL=1|jgi:hypothetical protein
MKKIAGIGLVLVVASMSPADAQQTAPAPAESSLKIEMRFLDKAFKNLIDSLIFGNLKAVEEPFHAVHEAKVNTEKALKRGEIKLPKNPDKAREFVRMDGEFHRHLEDLLEAAGKGDSKGVQRMTVKLLNGCVQCHAKFRN